MSTESSQKQNFIRRLASAAVLVPLLLWLIYLAPTWATSVFVAFAAAAAAFELVGITTLLSRLQRVWVAVATASWLSVLVWQQTNLNLLLAALVVLTTIPLVASLAGAQHPEKFLPQIAWSIAAPIYIGTNAALLLLLQRHHPGWVVLAMTIAFLGDTGGYFVGKAWGKRKLAPLISPKKTWEGAIGGLLGSIIGALVGHFWYLPQLSLPGALVLGTLGGALGQLGDLCESLIKRGSSVKDSGDLIPGHGGMLDRIDALLFTAPITWLFVTWFQQWL